MKRREFIALLGGAAASWLHPVGAQPAGKVFRIGFVGLPTADSLPKRPEAFRAALRELGYQEGRNIVIDFRWADGHYDRLPALFAEMVRLTSMSSSPMGHREDWPPNGPQRRSRSCLPRQAMPWLRVL